MDFLDCPRCHERYVVPDAGGGDGWGCAACGAELRLVVRDLADSRRRVMQALHARHLRSTSRSLEEWQRRAASIQDRAERLR